MGWTVYNSDGKILQSAELGDNAVTSAKIADGAIVNADINASAAVALTKLATTTVSRALVSDGSGVISPSAVTSTEIGYLDGVTSAIQTQINAAGGDLSFGGDTFGADKVIGSNDAYSLSFETAGVVRMKIHGPVTNPTSAGAITMPTQPGVIAYGSATASNVTGNNTGHTMTWTEVSGSDYGGDFASNTFTAPVTGRYLVTAQAELSDGLPNVTINTIDILTSNRNWHTYSDPGSGGQYSFMNTKIVDMDVSDQMTILVRANGVGANNVDIEGGSSSAIRSALGVTLLA